MLSYRHAFHAGNFADVVKHAVLGLLAQALAKKDTPFCYLDTHSGIGRYDLHSAAAEKTGEYKNGIARLWQREDVPPSLVPYLAAVRALNPDGALRFYPGSPRVVRHLLRAQDRMVLMELHTNDYPTLKDEFARDAQVAVHHRDGYEGLNAFVPPKEKRGLVLIDPSYEVKSEFDAVVTALREAHTRWPTGMYALWYPVLDRPSVARLERKLQQSGIRKILVAELCVRPDTHPFGLNGCGMIVINPPWHFDEQLRAVMPWLHTVLAENQGSERVEWIVPE